MTYNKFSEFKADLDKWRLDAKHKVGDLWLSYPHDDRKRLIEYRDRPKKCVWDREPIIATTIQ